MKVNYIASLDEPYDFDSPKYFSKNDRLFFFPRKKGVRHSALSYVKKSIPRFVTAGSCDQEILKQEPLNSTIQRWRLAEFSGYYLLVWNRSSWFDWHKIPFKQLLRCFDIGKRF